MESTVSSISLYYCVHIFLTIVDNFSFVTLLTLQQRLFNMGLFLPHWQQYTVWFAFKDDIFIHTVGEPVSNKQTSRISKNKGILYGCSLAGSIVRGKRFCKLIPAGDGVTLDVPRFKISSIINKRESGWGFVCPVFKHARTKLER